MSWLGVMAAAKKIHCRREASGPAAVRSATQHYTMFTLVDVIVGCHCRLPAAD
jgi:hypothetical protein